MNTVYTLYKLSGSGQVKGFSQADEGFKLHIVSRSSKSHSNVQTNLHVTLTPKQFKYFSSHLAELARNKLLVIDFDAEIIGVRAASSDRGRPTLHLDATLVTYKVAVVTNLWW
jgi:TPP-dependent 2-oxoacid decarboxylase